MPAIAPALTGRRAACGSWPPVSPWETLNEGNKSWMKPGFVYSNPANDGDRRVITEADYRARKY